MRMQAILIALLASSFEPKPPLTKPENPSEIGRRTVPVPAKPESEQPPPDAVGKVPKDLEKAAREKETKKLFRAIHRH